MSQEWDERGQRRLLPWPWALLGVVAVIASFILLPPLVSIAFAIGCTGLIVWWMQRPLGHSVSDHAVAADEELLTAEDVAERLRVKPDWIYTLVARDGIPYVRTGGRWYAPELRFRWSEIQQWVQREGDDEPGPHADS
jgi:excisionase family DNA binding protein